MHAQPQPREAPREVVETDAGIVKFPVNEWDRLERWARIEQVRVARAFEARNEALARL